MAFYITGWDWKKQNHTSENVQNMSPRKAVFDSLHCDTFTQPFKFMVAEGGRIWMMYWGPV